MNKTVVQLPAGPTAAVHSQPIVKRIRFLPDAGPRAKVRRTFVQPRVCFAVDEAANFADLLGQNSWSELRDQLIVVHFCRAGAETKKFSESFMRTPDHHDGVVTAASSRTNRARLKCDASPFLPDAGSITRAAMQLPCPHVCSHQLRTWAK